MEWTTAKKKTTIDCLLRSQLDKNKEWLRDSIPPFLSRFLFSALQRSFRNLINLMLQLHTLCACIWISQWRRKIVWSFSSVLVIRFAGLVSKSQLHWGEAGARARCCANNRTYTSRGLIKQYTRYDRIDDSLKRSTVKSSLSKLAERSLGFLQMCFMLIN